MAAKGSGTSGGRSASGKATSAGKSTAGKATAKSTAKAAGTRTARGGKNSSGSAKGKVRAAESDWLDPGALVGRLSDFAEGALNIASLGGSGLRLGRAILSRSPETLKGMQEAGEYLKDLREVAGMTQRELGEALEMRDESLIDAVENGTATLSFELILRLAAVLARHDPIPFIIRFTRTYRPELWRLLDDWGVGRVPLQFERERHFINMYRSHDAARGLSDEGFDKVLKFTRSAFEAALHFAAELEGIAPESKGEPDAAERNTGKGGKEPRN